MPRLQFAILLVGLLGGAGSAIADPQLDRMQVISERMNALMNDAVIAELPAMAGNLPPPQWDDPMRDAFACVLEGYRGEAGETGVDAMLDQMESAMAGMTPGALMRGEMDAEMQMPDGLTEARSAEIMNSCGVIALMMERMMKSGAMDVMPTQ